MEKINDDIRKLINNLNERQKELSCLYKIKSILQEGISSTDQIFSKIVEILPQGYQYPEICRAKIVIDGKAIQTENFQTTDLKQTAKIRIERVEVGEIQVYYIKAVKSDAYPVFLLEEQKLINTIAEDIGQFIAMRQFKILLQDTRVVSENLNIPIELSNWLTKFSLKEDEIKEILTLKIDFKKGELIFKQGALSSYIVLFIKGLAKTQLEDINERTYIFKIVKPYEFIGLSSLFANEQYGFTASAIMPSSGYLIKKEIIKYLISQNTKFNFGLFNWYCENLNLIYHKLNYLANKQALGRLADTIIYLSKFIFDEQIIDNSISRKIIAELSGMSTESAVRTLSALKNDGIINISKRGIEIVNNELLKTLSIAG